jgi:hypothetical protein
MANYRYERAGTGEADFYIKETQTGHILRHDMKAGDAKHRTKQLNSGAGFNGWTPAFFLAKVGPIKFDEAE